MYLLSRVISISGEPELLPMLSCKSPQQCTITGLHTVRYRTVSEVPGRNPLSPSHLPPSCPDSSKKKR